MSTTSSPQSSGVNPAYVGAGATILAVVIAQYVQYGQFERRLAEDRNQFLQKMDAARKDSDDARQRELEQRKKEFKLRFYEKQMQVYLEITDLVGKIVNTKPKDDVASSVLRLKELTTGHAALLADDRILRAISDFLKEYNAHGIKSTSKRKAWEIALACRESLGENFDMPRVIGHIPQELFNLLGEK